MEPVKNDVTESKPDSVQSNPNKPGQEIPKQETSVLVGKPKGKLLDIPNTHTLTPEERLRGQSARTEKKKLLNQLKALKNKKCKNCHLGCPFREKFMEENLDTTCKIPEANKMMLKLATDPEAIGQKLKLLLLDMDLISAKSGSIRDKSTVYNNLIEFKKEFCPATTTIKYEGQIDMGLAPGEVFKIAQETEARKKENATKDKSGNTTTVDK